MPKFRLSSSNVFPPSRSTRAEVHLRAESQTKHGKAKTQPTKPKPGRPSKSTHAEKHRLRPHRLDKLKHAARAAAKYASKRPRRIKREPCTAYVGNIGPDVDEKALITHFSSCGKILSARIHCCGGVAMTVKPPPPSYTKNMKVRQYGIIIFESKMARIKACKMGGILAGRKITVSVAISDLPEVREKIQKRLDEYRSRLEPPDERRARNSALRSLRLEPTVLLDPQQGNERESRNPFQICGMSFQEGIM